MPQNDYLLIGKIIGAHGIKGYFKIISYADSLSVFNTDHPILVKTSLEKQQNHIISWIKPHGRFALMALEGSDDRDGAESLVGAELYLSKSQLPELDEDTYYWIDLIGTCVNTLEGDYIGRIESIITTGANDVYIVRDEERETLIPALASVVLEVDLEKKQMVVDLPVGL